MQNPITCEVSNNYITYSGVTKIGKVSDLPKSGLKNCNITFREGDGFNNDEGFTRAVFFLEKLADGTSACVCRLDGYAILPLEDLEAKRKELLRKQRWCKTSLAFSLVSMVAFLSAVALLLWR